MSIQKKSCFAVWIVYFLIGFEILYMISPFGFYYYSIYGPGLNLFNQTPYTAWLSGFFLPHIVKTGSPLLNSVKPLGWILTSLGFLFFFIGAGQIYFNKFTGRGEVTGGIYNLVRHPQYTSLAICGFGLLLVWPRFIVLIMFTIMLFVYFFLARYEEKECLDKYGDPYRSYMKKTGMFIPVRISVKPFMLPQNRLPRLITMLGLYLATLMIVLSGAMGIRSLAISTLPVRYSEKAVTISISGLSNQEIKELTGIALQDPGVAEKLQLDKSPGFFLNYVMPAGWYLSDLPGEVIPKGCEGHYQPEDYDRNQYKILFTRAQSDTTPLQDIKEVLTGTSRRVPVLIVRVDRQLKKVTAITLPQPNVRWGDISTPLF